MKIKLQKPEALTPYANNPRVISDDAVAVMVESLKKYGFTQPIVVDETNTVVIGHTRLRGALELRLPKVPTVVRDDLSDDEIRKLRLVDNRMGELTGWDMDLLGSEMTYIDDELIGFDDDEVQALRAIDELNNDQESLSNDDDDNDPASPLPNSPGNLVQLTFFVSRPLAQKAKEMCEKVISDLEGADANTD